jgi:hypothetical protein
MKTHRLWVARALVLLALCGVFLIIRGLRGEESPSGPVWGSVRVHGRALTGGAVVFIPTDDTSEPASAPIEPDGSYVVNSVWHRPDNSTTQYKICILPPRRGLARWDGRRSAQVVPVSFSPGSAGSPDREEEEFAVPQRLGSYLTTDLEVKLDREPTRIDIDLKD